MSVPSEWLAVQCRWGQLQSVVGTAHGVIIS